MTQPRDVTGLLVAWTNGNEEANDRIIEAVSAELRRLARGYLRRERPDHSLAPTALVDEVSLPLVDHARAHGTTKRGSLHRVPLLDLGLAVQPDHIDVIAPSAAVARLAAFDSRQSRLVALQLFGGLTRDESAAVQGVAPIPVRGDWALANGWLSCELRGEA